MLKCGYNLRKIKQVNVSEKIKEKVKKNASKIVKSKNINIKSKKHPETEENNANVKAEELKSIKKRKLQNSCNTTKKAKVQKLTERTSLNSDATYSQQNKIVKVERKNIGKTIKKKNTVKSKSSNLNLANQKLQHESTDVITYQTLKNLSTDSASRKVTEVNSDKLTVNNQKVKMKSIKSLIKNQEKSLEIISKVSEEKFVGAHVSISGGIHKAVTNAVAIGAKSFGLFLRSQRQWIGKPLSSETANLFREACKIHNFSSHLIIPHGSYLLNCGSPNQEILEKSRQVLIDELKRCEMLGLMLFNFHPGSTCGLISIEECIQKIAESINIAHRQTKNVITVIENMSKQGYTVGGDFRELHAIIDLVADKSRIGVCLDTCHAFAAGYDISYEEGFNEMMSDFENIIGLQYLKAVHLNDSVGKLGCHLDRHENIGRGYIGINGFKLIMNDDRFNNIPLILETPANIDDEDEIKILYSLCNV